jgi:hypothetical protein
MMAATLGARDDHVGCRREEASPARLTMLGERLAGLEPWDG